MRPALQHPELDFDRPTAEPPPAEPAEVVALELYLRGKGWVYAREIIHDNPSDLNLPPNPEKAKRKLRKIAQAGRRVILSFPGSHGYRALCEASKPEIEHARAAHMSQADEHKAAVVALDRFLYRDKQSS